MPKEALHRSSFFVGDEVLKPLRQSSRGKCPGTCDFSR
jgi:hypothetical protein